MITDDRRAFKRTNHKFTITFKLHGGFTPLHGTSFSKNISFGGVYFTSLEKIEIGQLFDCYIKMPGIPQEGKWTARVVRCENVTGNMVETFGIASEFVKSFGDSEKKLKKALSE